MHTRSLVSLALFLAASALVAGAGSMATASSVTTWYPELVKPPFNPPGWVFGPVWTMLYVMMAIAGWRVWRDDHRLRRRALCAYAVQLALNLCWSLAFFGLQSPALGLAVIAALLAAIITTTALFFRIDRVSGLLFIPYLAWVSFAAILNLSLWWLN